MDNEVILYGFLLPSESDKEWMLRLLLEMIFFIIFSRRKSACKPPESRWLSPPIDTRNTIGVNSALPASTKGIEYLKEERASH
ncbi:hypothetical protein EVAR_50415_1 [Eumeta japonica]|uniref:Uncharacterized protein n=1 Tax=Eumeta variegata TaxID=151549 RepID=A0A4C1WUH0_EUMVA|nr:hypothetical protein EVAR_50415_1 [Eumeta japonica]